MVKAKLSQAFLGATFAACLLPLAAQAELPEFTSLVRANEAAVVNISTTQTVHSTGWEMPAFPEGAFPEGSPFEQFFKRFGEGAPQPHDRQAQSLGSGFVISADGKILTNAHVVDGADSIIVRLADHSEKPAKVIGVDKTTDVALLKIDAKNLPIVKLGDSSKLEVGNWVLAIGSPFGLEHTATQGIVSALGRSLPDDSYVPFIQTDVALNPGNSGGPLFNTAGEVVGINSQIYSRTGGYMGLSFAIPINVARNVATQLETKGYVSHGWLGIGIQGVSGELAQSFGLDKPRGALVGKIDADGPAAKSGLRSGDIILQFDGKPVGQSSDLPPMVGDTTPGKSVVVQVWRDRKAQNLNLTVGAQKRDDEDAKVASAGPKPGRLNIQVSPLTAEQRSESGVDKGGVLVVDVGDGPAARAGIEAGDILLSINNRTVSSPQQLADMVKALPANEPVAVLIQREDRRLFLPLTLSG